MIPEAAAQVQPICAAVRRYGDSFRGAFDRGLLVAGLDLRGHDEIPQFLLPASPLLFTIHSQSQLHGLDQPYDFVFTWAQPLAVCGSWQ